MSLFMKNPWSLCVCVRVCVCVCVHVHVFRLFWLKSVMLKKTKTIHTYIHIHGTPALMITLALATPQVLTSDIASSAGCFWLVLSASMYTSIAQLKELAWVCHKQLSICRSPSSASIFNTSEASTWCTRSRQVQGHKISSSQFLKDQKSWLLIHDHKHRSIVSMSQMPFRSLSTLYYLASSPGAGDKIWLVYSGYCHVVHYSTQLRAAIHRAPNRHVLSSRRLRAHVLSSRTELKNTCTCKGVAGCHCHKNSQVNIFYGTVKIATAYKK